MVYVDESSCALEEKYILLLLGAVFFRCQLIKLFDSVVQFFSILSQPLLPVARKAIWKTVRMSVDLPIYPLFFMFQPYVLETHLLGTHALGSFCLFGESAICHYVISCFISGDIVLQFTLILTLPCLYCL